jgi:hypothetical protein
MDFQIGLVIAGLTVGFIVGLTGVGWFFYDAHFIMVRDSSINSCWN